MPLHFFCQIVLEALKVSQKKMPNGSVWHFV